MSTIEAEPLPQSRRADVLTSAMLIIALLVSALAFWLPWRPSQTAPAALEQYVPASDGRSSLIVTHAADGTPESWTSTTTRQIGSARAFTIDLRFAAAKGIQTYFGTAGHPATLDDAIAKLQHGVQVITQQSRQIDTTGTITDSLLTILRTPDGDRAISLYLPASNQDLTFEPALNVFPASFEPGYNWQQQGSVNGTLSYSYTGRIDMHGPRQVAGHEYADCVQITSTYQLANGLQLITNNRSQEWYCAQVGLVERTNDDLLTQFHTRDTLVATDGVQPTPDLLPPAHSLTTTTTAPRSNISDWQLLRWGRSMDLAEPRDNAFPPTYIPSEPPLLLCQGIGGELIALDAIDPSAAERWRFRAGGTTFKPPAFDPQTGRIFFGASDKRIYALDSHGVYLWSFTTNDSVAATPLIAGDLLIVGSEDHTIYALDAATGTKRWERVTDGPIVSSAVFVAGLVVVGGDDGQIRALDPQNGDIRWIFDAGSPVEAPLVVADQQVFIASHEGSVIAVDPTNGQEIWRSAPTGTLRNAPAVDQQSVYVADRFGTLTAFDRATGLKRWAKSNRTAIGPPIVNGDTLLITYDNGMIAALGFDGTLQHEWDVSTVRSPRTDQPRIALGLSSGGGALWAADDNAEIYRLGPPSGPTPLKVAGYHSLLYAPFHSAQGAGLYFTPVPNGTQTLAIDSLGHFFDLTNSRGKPIELGSTDWRENIAPDPLIAGDAFVIAAAGQIIAFDINTWHTRWKLDLPNEQVQVLPPAANNDTVFVASVNGEKSRSMLRAINLDSGTERWKIELGPGASGVLVAGDTVYTSSPPAAFDAATGQQRWRNALGTTYGNSALSSDGRNLFVNALDLSGKPSIVALDTTNGKLRWRSIIDGTVKLYEPVWVSGDTSIVPLANGQLVALRASDGQIRWQTPPAPRYDAPSVIDGRIWLTRLNGQVEVYSAKTGKLLAFSALFRSNLDSAGLVLTRPVAVKQGILFLLGSDLVIFEVPQ